jgi:large subunit ribosomal protein L22
MKAFLKNYRQSPRKVRLVADLIRGKDVERARMILSFMDQKSAPVVKKLLDSAIANARQAPDGLETEGLIVKEIRVDEGTVLKRWMPKARGRATPIRKPSSRITVVLGEKPEETKPTKKKNSTKALKRVSSRSGTIKKSTPRKPKAVKPQS